MQDHTIICGYGSKGRSAAKSMLGAGVDPSRIVIIDSSEQALADAKGAGLAAVAGDATHIGILHAAGVEEAAAVVVAANRDDAARPQRRDPAFRRRTRGAPRGRRSRRVSVQSGYLSGHVASRQGPPHETSCS